MSISDAQFAAWLVQDNNQRITLAQVDYKYEDAGAPASGTLYYSDGVYSVGEIAYVDCIDSVPTFTRALSGDRFSLYTSSIGSLELQNADGALDTVLALSCDGSEVRFYVGDETWPIDDFRLIFSALVMRVAAPTEDRISIQLKDASRLLDKTIGGDVLVGGTGPNADRYRPVNFGYVRQVECLLVDFATLTYAYNDTGDGVYTSTDTTNQTVRDRGIPVDFTDNGDGTFSLLASPDGLITADVLVAPGGSASYRCTSDAMEAFVGTRGGMTAAGRYTGPGPTYFVRPALDVSATHGEDYLIGISIGEKRNLHDILEELTDSGLCFWAITRLGQFTFGRLRPNYIAKLEVASSATIIEDDYDDGSFRLDRVAPTYHKIQAIMSRNWTRSDDLATSLNAEDKATLTRTGLYGVQDAAVGTTYELAPELYNLTLVESPTLSTLLSGPSDVDDIPSLDAWMVVRKAVMLPWLDIVSVTVGLDYYERELGDVTTLQVPRFGYDAGVEFQVLSVGLRLTDAKVDLRLIRRHIQVPYDSDAILPVPDAAPDAVILPMKAFIEPANITFPMQVPGGGSSGARAVFRPSGSGLVIGMSFMFPTQPRPADGFIIIEPGASGYHVDGPSAHYTRLRYGTSIPTFVTDEGSPRTFVGTEVTGDHEKTYVAVFDGLVTYGGALGVPCWREEQPASIDFSTTRGFSGGAAITYLRGGRADGVGGGYSEIVSQDLTDPSSFNYGCTYESVGGGTYWLHSWKFKALGVWKVAYWLSPTGLVTSGASHYLGVKSGTEDIPALIAGVHAPLPLFTSASTCPWNPDHWPADRHVRSYPSPINPLIGNRAIAGGAAAVNALPGGSARASASGTSTVLGTS